MAENETAAGQAPEIVIVHDLPDDRPVPVSEAYLAEVLKHQSSAWLRRFAEDNEGTQWAQRARQIHDQRTMA